MEPDDKGRFGFNVQVSFVLKPFTNKKKETNFRLLFVFREVLILSSQ
jgi:hypothetical protein